MTIALLCPTRARPDQLKRMITSALATATERVDIYVGISEEDRALYALNGCRPYSFPDGMPTAHKWNMLAYYAGMQGASLFMLCADDVVFSTPCWDKALLDHYNALENKIHVYHLRDSRNENGTPHPIVTREYIEAMGYFLPPLFLHWFVDTWTVEIAKANNCFTHLKDYQLLHDKPSDRGQADETHNKIRHMGWHDRDKWVHEHCGHFLEFEKKRLGKAIAQSMSMEERRNAKFKGVFTA